MRNRNGDITCELSVFCMEAGIMQSLSGVKFNINSLNARRQIVSGIKAAGIDEGVVALIDWNNLINDISWRVIKFYSNGQGTEDIWPQEEIPQPAYLLFPILPLHQPTIIFGDGGSGKGYISIVLSVIAQLPYHDNPLDLVTMDEPTNVLYCDYESDSLDFQNRLSGICNGFGINTGVKRLQMSAPIHSCIDQLYNKVKDDNIGMVCIDSLGPAAGGNINDAEPAIKLYTALRKLGDVTTLIIAHNSKDPLTKRKSVYGSVFFTNLARSVWEIKKSQDIDTNEMLISISHIKYNRKKQMPIGLSFTFDDETGVINTRLADLKGTELSADLPLAMRIQDTISHEPMTVKELGEILENSDASIRTTLYRMKTKGIVIQINDKWGLYYGDEN